MKSDVVESEGLNIPEFKKFVEDFKIFLSKLKVTQRKMSKVLPTSSKPSASFYKCGYSQTSISWYGVKVLDFLLITNLNF